jgi:phage shock protein A
MSLTTIIILSVIALLLIIGATQRKKLVLLIRSETNSALKNVTSNSKVLSLRISDLKSHLGKVVDSAGDLYAKEELFTNNILALSKNILTTKEEAKKAKADGNESNAKTKLTLYFTLKNELELLNANLDTVTKAKHVIETKVSHIKARITEYEVKLDGLKARESVNTVLAKTRSVVGLSFVDSIDNSLDQLETKVSTDEFKNKYLNSDEEEVDYSDAVNDEFDKLS